MNKTALFISIALTTFVLIAIGGVVYFMRPDPVVAAPGEEAAPATEETTADPTAGMDPALVQAIQAREAEYQKLIQDANTRLVELQQQLAVQTVAPVADPALDASQQITPEQAAQIAADYIGQTQVYWVQLVTLQGASVYEVTFYAGDMVYVSMDGQVVASAPAPVSAGGGRASSSSPGTSMGDNGGGQDGEHEDGEHEEAEHEDEGGDHD